MQKITFDEIDKIQDVESVLEVMSFMGSNESIDTFHVANVAADCCGKLKGVLKNIEDRGNKDVAN